MYSNSNNHLYPVIYIAESPEQAINYEWDSRSSALNKNVKVMDLESILKLKDENDQLYLPHDLTPCEILIRDPDPSRQGYVLATDAENVFLETSRNNVFRVAQLLGATNVKYEKNDIAEYTREIDSNNELKYKAVDIGLNVNVSEKKKILNRIGISCEFPKQEFTMDMFAKAKSFAQERGLLESREICSLIDARDPSHVAPLIHKTVDVEISSSLNKALDIAFSVNCVGSLFNLSSNTRIATKKKLVLNIKWDIMF